jgi:hypothetical protein
MNPRLVEIGVDERLAVKIQRLFDDPDFFDSLSVAERQKIEGEMDAALSGLAHSLTD